MYYTLKHFAPVEYLMIFGIVSMLVSAIYFIKLSIKAPSFQKMGLAAFIFLTTSFALVGVLSFINIDLMKKLFIFAIIIFPIWVASGLYISYKRGGEQNKKKIKVALRSLALLLVAVVIFYTIMWFLTIDQRR